MAEDRPGFLSGLWRRLNRGVPTAAQVELARGADPLDLLASGRYEPKDVYPQEPTAVDELLSSERGQQLMLLLGFLGAKSAPMVGRYGGIPSTVKLPGGEVVQTRPIPEVMAAHRDYMARAGIDADMPAAYPKMDKARAARIAETYDRAPHAPDDPAVKASYQKLADEVLAQYDALDRRGIRFKFMRPDGEGGVVDPYAKSPALGYKSLRDKGVLEIFPTETGYGSTNNPAGVDANPMLRFSGRYFDGKPATVNDVFRAVHDAYGHFGPGNSFFRAPGEERAWAAHSTMFSPEARMALTGETRGQNSWVNYGPHGEANRTASGASTVYAPQKSVAMPEWTVTEGLPPTRPAPREANLPRSIVRPDAGLIAPFDSGGSDLDP